MSALPPKATSEAFFRLAALGQKWTFRAFGSDRVEKEAKTRCVTEKMAAPRAKALPLSRRLSGFQGPAVVLVNTDSGHRRVAGAIKFKGSFP
jgi:hypothetical protein